MLEPHLPEIDINDLQLEVSRKQTLNLSTHLAVFELLTYSLQVGDELLQNDQLQQQYLIHTILNKTADYCPLLMFCWLQENKHPYQQVTLFESYLNLHQLI